MYLFIYCALLFSITSLSAQLSLDVQGNGAVMGNLGIGTSIPTQKLDVNGNILEPKKIVLTK